MTPWGRSDSLRERRLRPGPGTRPEEVAENQRQRLFGAMVASVSVSGYAATRITDLVELSGVSRRTLYDLFPDKQSCFAAAVEAAFAAALELAGQAEGDGDWRQRARGRLGILAGTVVDQPAAARMCLIDAYAAGDAATKPLETAIAAIEQLTARSFAESPERAEMPAEMVSGLVGGGVEVVRNRLQRGGEAELPGLVEELIELILSYRAPPQPLRSAKRLPAPAPETLSGHDHSERLLRAFAATAAEQGYEKTTMDQVLKRASMSSRTLRGEYAGKEDVMLAAIDSSIAQLMAAVMPTFRRYPNWPEAVRAAFGALFNFLTSRPALARLLIVEAYAAGAAALKRREEALRPLGLLLAAGRARSPRVPGVTIEAITGAILSLARRQILRSGAESLSSLAPICTYIALVPFIGAEQAAAAANEDGPGQLSKLLSTTYPLQSRVLEILSKGAASAAEIEAEISEPRETVVAVFDELAREGLIEMVEEVSAEGPRYRASSRWFFDDFDWAQMSLAERQEASVEVGQMITSEIELAIAAGSFDARIDRHMARGPLQLDEQGWARLSAIYARTFRASLEIQAESAERLKKTGAAPIGARAIQLLFETPPQ
jgi:AcrR family transcriptional regulator